MTDQMVWALREKCAKGMSARDMAETYGIPQRIVAAVTGGTCYYYDRYWPCEDLWHLRELICEGYDRDEIAAVLGTTRKTVANVINHNQDLFRALDWRG